MFAVSHKDHHENSRTQLLVVVIFHKLKKKWHWCTPHICDHIWP